MLKVMLHIFTGAFSFVVPTSDTRCKTSECHKIPLVWLGSRISRIDYINYEYDKIISEMVSNIFKCNKEG